MSETKTNWHRFPDEKPPRKQTYYLVTMKGFRRGDPPWVTTMRWMGRTWMGSSIDVMAWTELPEPYEEER